MSKFEDLAPAGNDWVVRELNALRAEIEELRAARSVEATTISAGVFIVDRDGGLRVIDKDTGNIVFYAGIGDVTGKSIVYWNRGDDTRWLGVDFISETLEQVGTWRDRAGVVVVSDDRQGVGLARPYLQTYMTPQFTNTDPLGTVFSYRNLPVAEVATEKVLWEGSNYISHPYIEINGTWGSAAGSSNSTYRLKLGGVTVGTWTRTGTEFGSTIEGPFDIRSFVGDRWSTTQLTCAVAAAPAPSGRVACEVYGLLQRESPAV